MKGGEDQDGWQQQLFDTQHMVMCGSLCWTHISDTSQTSLFLMGIKTKIKKGRY